MINYNLIKILTINSGVKVKDIAREIGVSYLTYNNWLNGRNKPHLLNLKKVADYFGVSIKKFMEDKNEIN